MLAVGLALGSLSQGNKAENDPANILYSPLASRSAHRHAHVSQAQANKTVVLQNAAREAGNIWFPAKLKWEAICSLCHQAPYKDLYTFHFLYTKHPPTTWLGEASEGRVPLPYGSLLLWSRYSSADSVVCELNTSPPPLPIHPHTIQCGVIDGENNRISH